MLPRYFSFKFLRAGVDLGYGLSLSDNFDGGFYYRAAAGLDFDNAVEFSLIFHSILLEETSAISSIGLGLMYKFPKR